MMRYALNAIGAHSETTAIIGDRMDTDVVAGLEAGMYTILVLTGSTTPDDVERYPYRPSRIVESVADLLAELEEDAIAPTSGARLPMHCLVQVDSGPLGFASSNSRPRGGRSSPWVSRGPRRRLRTWGILALALLRRRG